VMLKLGESRQTKEQQVSADEDVEQPILIVSRQGSALYLFEVYLVAQRNSLEIIKQFPI
jgi:hypothetical protein